MKKKDILVTEANFPTSMWVTRSLAKKGLKVIGIAQRKNCGVFSRYYNERIIVKNESQYLSKIKELAFENDLTIFPHLETTYLDIYSSSDNLKIIAPPREQAKNMTDKTHILHRLQHELTQFLPDTIIIHVKRDRECKILNIIQSFLKEYGKIIVKTHSEIGIPYGPGNRYLVLKYDHFPPNVQKKVLSFIKSKKKVIVQNYVRGTGVGVGGLWFKGNPLVVGGHKRLRMSHTSGGVSTVAISYCERHIMDAAFNIMQCLDFTGIALVEFKYDPRDHKLYFMEINPRIWGTLPLYIMSGADIPWCALNFFQEGKTDFSYHFKTGIKMKYFFNDIDAILRNYTGVRRIAHLLKSFFSLDFKEALFALDDPLPFLMEALYYSYHKTYNLSKLLFQRR